ncbi:MAG: IgGFc-binding protein [bacterium]|nr:IgGFc-binding protein [bacterium]
MTTSKRHLLVCLSFLVSVGLTAQKRTPKADELLGLNAAQGKEFWIAIPPNELTPFPVDELDIYIASAYDTDVKVFDAGAQREFTRKVKAGDITTLTDSLGETNWAWEVREFEVPIKKGIRITSKYPIVVYVLNSKVTTSDGYLAIPTAAWGTDYIHCSYYDFREVRNWAGGFLVVAKENGTHLDIELRGVGELDARTAGGKKINTGVHFNVTLDEGEVYMVKGDGTTRGIFDLTGTRIRSTKPVGLISFHERTTMPNLLVAGNGRNHLSEMLPSVDTWGLRYPTIEFKREHLNGIGKGDVFRVVASEPNTKWTVRYYDMSSKALMGQGGGTLAKSGDFADIIQSTAPTALTSGYSVWEADKPILVMQYSCSQSWDGDPSLDPFMIRVVPEEQFVSDALFETPTAAKFSKHFLDLIVWADTADANYINNLKSLELNSVPVWNHPTSQVPTLLFNHMPGNQNLHWVRIELGTTGKSLRLISNSKVRFGGQLYGYGAADAYGWPAASAYRTTSSIDTMPPVLVVDNVCGDYNVVANELRNIPNPPTTPPLRTDQVESGISQIFFDPAQPDSNFRLVLVTDTILRSVPTYKTFRFRVEIIDKTKDAFARVLVLDDGYNTTTGSPNQAAFVARYTAPKLSGLSGHISFGKHRVLSSPPISCRRTPDCRFELQRSTPWEHIVAGARKQSLRSWKRQNVTVLHRQAASMA